MAMKPSARPSPQPNDPALGLPENMDPNPNTTLPPNLIKSGPTLAQGSGKQQFTLEVLPKLASYKR